MATGRCASDPGLVRKSGWPKQRSHRLRVELRERRHPSRNESRGGRRPSTRTLGRRCLGRTQTVPLRCARPRRNLRNRRWRNSHGRNGLLARFIDGSGWSGYVELVPGVTEELPRESVGKEERVVHATKKSGTLGSRDEGPGFSDYARVRRDREGLVLLVESSLDD